MCHGLKKKEGGYKGRRNWDGGGGTGWRTAFAAVNRKAQDRPQRG